MRRRGDVMMERHCYVFLRRCYDVPIRDAALRRLRDVPSRRDWVFSLRRTWNVVQRDVAATSPRRLNAGWDSSRKIVAFSITLVRENTFKNCPCKKGGQKEFIYASNLLFIYI